MDRIVRIIRLAREQVKGLVVPIVTLVAEKKDPFLVLVSCILSLRTKDKTTAQACRRLFKAADDPGAMARLSCSRIEKLIYPVGFFRTKAKAIRELSKRLCAEFNGKVPDDLDTLLGFKGVGRKTANLVLGLGFGMPAICVDSHVHQISNRLGWVRTKDPEDTEFSLARIIPRKYWIELNTILVAFGQNICLPVSPRCGICRIKRYCKMIGVKYHR
ncbi:MAG: endonuclease III [Candidatus Omnitrophica bacterium]|jgi:endonuclease-3|nr:endonuclease III [Candidatus Omnitrophota bacterium]MDD5079346.1 endonuclease III [Candidatus Omnitrophota bacterium]